MLRTARGWSELRTCPEGNESHAEVSAKQHSVRKTERVGRSTDKRREIRFALLAARRRRTLAPLGGRAGFFASTGRRATCSLRRRGAFAGRRSSGRRSRACAIALKQASSAGYHFAHGGADYAGGRGHGGGRGFTTLSSTACLGVVSGLSCGHAQPPVPSSTHNRLAQFVVRSAERVVRAAERAGATRRQYRSIIRNPKQ
jgi:hypothetical protein